MGFFQFIEKKKKKCKPKKFVSTSTCKCIHAVANGDMTCPSEGGSSIKATSMIVWKRSLWILWLTSENLKKTCPYIEYLAGEQKLLWCIFS